MEVFRLKIPLFQALSDIQMLSHLYPTVQFTQYVDVHILNDQVELPLHISLYVAPTSTITPDFLQHIDHLLQIYETVVFAVTVKQGTTETVRRLDDAEEERHYIGTADRSNTHFMFRMMVNDQGFKKRALQPITRSNPKGYRPTMDATLTEAMHYFNQALLPA